MRKLEPHDLLALWERGSSRHALDRSALLCAWARPELPAGSIADLPLGEVTASVLRLRAAWFGERIEAHVDCTSCGERLEISLSVPEVLQPTSVSVALELRAAGARYRLPCLRDLAAVASEQDAEPAAQLLLSRCRLRDAEDEDVEASAATLIEVESAFEAADPNADLAFEVRCEACGNTGAAQLDVGALLWDEIDVQAQALLADVHRLARAYGWTEREILALSPARRVTYLSMVAT